MALTPLPTREVICAEALTWLRANPLQPGDAVVTSLPDVSEFVADPGSPGRRGEDLATWKTWFTQAAQLICEQVHPSSVAIFYQTDIKRDGRWIDKGFLVQTAAERAGVHLLWHKLVCRVAPGHATFGRPAYTHLLCFSRDLRLDLGKSTADVLPALGKMTWSRAMGQAACEHAVDLIKHQTACTRVVDPFCGKGSVLAVAQRMGLASLGIELSAKRARQAQTLNL